MQNPASPKAKAPVSAYLMLSLCGCLWAGNAIAGKIAVGHVTPYTLTLMRWLISLCLILPFSFKFLKVDWPQIRAHWLYLFLQGMLGFSLFNILMYQALQHTSTINVAIEQAAMPLIVFAFNFLLYRIGTTRHQIIGFVITLTGVAIAITRGQINTLLTLDFNIGDLLMLLAVSFYGIYSVQLRNKPQIHWTSFIIVLGFAAMLSALPFFLYEFYQPGFIIPDRTGWLVIVYAALGPSILAQVFWMQGLAVVGANRGGVFINFVPVATTLFAVLILGENLQFYHIAAMALVMIGVIYSQRK